MSTIVSVFTKYIKPYKFYILCLFLIIIFMIFSIYGYKWFYSNKQKNIEYSVQTVDPNEYENKFINELLDSNRFSDLISQYEIPQGENLAADFNEDEEKRFILTGSIEALNLIDKNRDDFNKYLYAKF